MKVPTLEEFVTWCSLQEAYDPDMFHIAVSAWWRTYHEATMQ